MNDNHYIRTITIEVKQPFDVFYVCKLSASQLLEISFSDPIRYEEGGNRRGVQRQLDEDKRVREIKEFVEGVDAAIPNSIILAANYDENGLNVRDESIRWRIDNGHIIIPTNEKVASIIDGQHRVRGFEKANVVAKEMELICSVYFDLPNALQAFVFATINSNQKPVDKSLSYEQFGFNIDNEPSTSWSPDKLAISFYRKLNEDSRSPFYRHIKIAPQIDEVLRSELSSAKWLVSTATVVDGIVRLISNNPKKDRYILQKLSIPERVRGILVADSSPFRELYKENQDVVIFKTVENFFHAADQILISNANDRSAIIKTVGIQALFDFLKIILGRDKQEDSSFRSINLRQSRFAEMLQNVSGVDFTDSFYQYSAVGRANILETLLLYNNLTVTPKEEDAINDSERKKIQKKIEQHQKIRSLEKL